MRRFNASLAAAMGARAFASQAGRRAMPFTRFAMPAAFVGGATAFAFGTTAVFCAPWSASPAEDKSADWKAVRKDIVDLLEKNNNTIGPVLIRLAWHEAGTWDPKAEHNGCPNSASMRFAPECNHGANAGLKIARDLLEPIKKKYPTVSYADLWALAAGVAIEEMGGPKIPFRAGRQDATSPAQCSPDGRLPDAAQGQDHVRALFVKRMGFSEAETVALIGAHTVGECHADRSGYVGPWSHDKLGFDNSFYGHLLNEEWLVDTRYSKLQFTDRATKKLMMLPGDIAFVLDPVFKKHVKRFADNQDTFHAEFAKAFQKLVELGTKDLKPVSF